MLGRVADRCEKLGTGLGPGGTPGITIRALMADLEALAVPLTSFSSRLAWLPVHNPRTPMEALTAQILRVAALAGPAERKNHELRQLAAHIAALPPQGTGSIDPDPPLEAQA